MVRPRTIARTRRRNRRASVAVSRSKAPPRTQYCQANVLIDSASASASGLVPSAISVSAISTAPWWCMTIISRNMLGPPVPSPRIPDNKCCLSATPTDATTPKAMLLTHVCSPESKSVSTVWLFVDTLPTRQTDIVFES